MSDLQKHMYLPKFCKFNMLNIAGGKKKRKYSGCADTDSDWLPSVKGKQGGDETPKRKSRRPIKPAKSNEQSILRYTDS